MNYVSIKSTEGKLILAATILASGMAFLDGSVVTIAIPVIQSTLHATLDSMQWWLIFILSCLLLLFLSVDHWVINWVENEYFCMVSVFLLCLLSCAV